VEPFPKGKMQPSFSSFIADAFGLKIIDGRKSGARVEFKSSLGGLGLLTQCSYFLAPGALVVRSQLLAGIDLSQQGVQGAREGFAVA